MQRCDCLDCDLLQGKLPLPDALSATQTKLHVLGIGLLLSGGFSLFEWAAGWWSHSLTLMADAGHMWTDCFAISLAIGATYLRHLVAERKATLDAEKAEILAALANGFLLIVLAVWVFWEAVNRFNNSHPAVVSSVMLVTAAIGLVVNMMAASVLHTHSHQDLNIRGAFLHVLADTLSSVGVIASAVSIGVFHWNWADEVISLCIAALIGVGAFPLICSSLQSLQAGYTMRSKA
jgi:cobalt-zinc-cadmium efflux system protein